MPGLEEGEKTDDVEKLLEEEFGWGQDISDQTILPHHTDGNKSYREYTSVPADKYEII